ncbi:hypothetical protein DY000_02015927 [Brassica cretica]|uniref:Uncharacterized protein n=1 Tax=Brassica cretica TaxID=69181 RepID=A0ABQ7CQK8_BRACR|nr:hypothetical protein DY000_02015927 [Brassica cretica]
MSASRYRTKGVIQVSLGMAIGRQPAGLARTRPMRGGFGYRYCRPICERVSWVKSHAGWAFAVWVIAGLAGQTKLAPLPLLLCLHLKKKERDKMAIHVRCSHDSIDEHQRSTTTNRFLFSSTEATTGASLRLLSTTITSLLGDPATETSLLPRASTGASLRLLTTTITFFLEIPPPELLSFLEPPPELLFFLDLQKIPP